MRNPMGTINFAIERNIQAAQLSTERAMFGKHRRDRLIEVRPK